MVVGLALGLSLGLVVVPVWATSLMRCAANYDMCLTSFPFPLYTRRIRSPYSSPCRRSHGDDILLSQADSFN